MPWGKLDIHLEIELSFVLIGWTPVGHKCAGHNWLSMSKPSIDFSLLHVASSMFGSCMGAGLGSCLSQEAGTPHPDGAEKLAQFWSVRQN